MYQKKSQFKGFLYSTIQLSKINLFVSGITSWELSSKRVGDYLLEFKLSENRAKKNGGGERDRTDDLLRARQALSQLSYTPIHKNMVGLGGLEPPTSRLSGVRSNQAEL